MLSDIQNGFFLQKLSLGLRMLLLWLALASFTACNKSDLPLHDCQKEDIEPKGVSSELMAKARIKKCTVTDSTERIIKQLGYNAQGKKIWQAWYDTLQQETVKEVWSYENGLLKEMERFHLGKPYATTNYIYSPDGQRLAKEVVTERRQVVDSYSYNEAGCLAKVNKVIYDLTKNKEVIYRASYMYAYKDDGLCDFREWRLSDGKLHAKWRYTYNAEGHLVESRFLNAAFQDQGRVAYGYSSDGKLLWKDDGQKKWIYQYDYRGLISQAQIIHAKGAATLEKYVYEVE